MQRVFVLDSNRKPLMPCHPARARELLRKGRAAVYRKYPFTVILKDRAGGDVQAIELKVDPGSKTTGVALVASFARGREVVWAGELNHRGWQIHKALFSRRAVRRSRRSRKTRYRKPRFDNRTKPMGWLPPSLRSRVDNVRVWGARLQRLAPVAAVAVETMRFDTQRIQNPEIVGVEYQEGTLAGCEMKQYLLEKWRYRCAYCGGSGVPLQAEHITPKSRGGTDRVSNLTVSCARCNQEKNNRTAAEYGHPDVQEQAQRPLKDAAAMNAMRYAVGDALKALRLPTTFWGGGRTKYNRTRQSYPKAHWIDAACVGESGEAVRISQRTTPLCIMARGRGSRQMCSMDRFGFPRTKAKALKRWGIFQTGDAVVAHITRGKYVGTHKGLLASVRATGQFDIKTPNGRITSHGRNFRLVQKADGYQYALGTNTTLSGGVRLTP